MPITFTDIFPPPYNEYLITYFIPFILLFAIFWGLLTAMKIFSKRINTFLALIFPLVFILGAPETFLWFSNYLISLGSFLAVGAFVALFVFGVISWALHRGRDIYAETGALDARIVKKAEQLDKLQQKYSQESNPAKQEQIAKDIERLERDKRMMEAERARIH